MLREGVAQWDGGALPSPECNETYKERPEDAQRTLRGAQRRSEDAQRACKGAQNRSEDAQRTLRGRSEALRGRSEDVQRRSEDAQKIIIFRCLFA